MASQSPDFDDNCRKSNCGTRRVHLRPPRGLGRHTLNRKSPQQIWDILGFPLISTLFDASTIRMLGSLFVLGPWEGMRLDNGPRGGHLAQRTFDSPSLDGRAIGKFPPPVRLETFSAANTFLTGHPSKGSRNVRSDDLHRRRISHFSCRGDCRVQRN